MSTETILRVAAKGDGVTESGRHIPRAAPGDAVAADGSLTPGAHHATPPCRHYGACGGCQLQHLDEETLAGFVTDRVVNAAEGQGLEPAKIAPAASLAAQQPSPCDAPRGEWRRRTADRIP